MPNEAQRGGRRDPDSTTILYDLGSSRAGSLVEETGQDQPAATIEVPSVLLIDDRRLTRESLVYRLQARAPYLSIEAFATGDEALRARPAMSPVFLFNIRGASVLKPGVQSAIERLAKAAAGDPLLVLSTRGDPDQAFRVLGLGARGLFPTSLGVRLLVGAIHLLHAGGTFLEPHLLQGEVPRLFAGHTPLA